jgi:hypothetical protein
MKVTVLLALVALAVFAAKLHVYIGHFDGR